MMKEEIKEDAASVALHGLPRVVTSKHHSEKVIWFLIWVASVGGFTYEVIGLMNKYNSHNIFTKYMQETRAEVDFPAITICNTNKEIYYEKPYTLKSYPSSCENSHRFNFSTDTDKENFLKGCSMFLSSMNNTCTFDFTHCKFPEHFMPDRSSYLCYTLNRDNFFRQVIMGYKFGLRMIIFLNDTDVTYSRESKSGSPVTEKREGITVMIHHRDIHASGLNRGIIASPGYLTEIKLSENIIRRQDAPYPSNCSKEGSSGYKQLFVGNYTIENCISACFYITFYEKCRYVHPQARVWMPEDRYPVNENKTESEVDDCFLKFLNKFDTANDCDCPIRCFEVVYDSEVSKSQWPSSWQIPEYRQFFCYCCKYVEGTFN